MSEKNKKTPLEQALLEMRHIQDTLSANAKEILATQMMPDIKRSIKESLTDLEQDGLDLETPEMPETGVEDLTGDEPFNGSEPMADVEFGADSGDGDLDLGEPVGDEEDGDLDNLPLDPTAALEDGDDELLDFDGEMDLTGASDDEVLKVFKKLPVDSEIEVIKNGNTIELKDGDAEYRIELSEGKEEDGETIYEIEFDDELSEEEEEDEPVEEGRARTFRNGKAQIARPDNFPAERKRAANESASRESDKLVRENADLRKQNETLLRKVEQLSELKDLMVKENKEYKDGLTNMRKKLQEVAIFNSNLTYITKLMTENATTKNEKSSIIERFEQVKDLNESKTLYKVISGELKHKAKPVIEAVEEKVNRPSIHSGSAQKGVGRLNESTMYNADPQIAKIHKLMYKK